MKTLKQGIRCHIRWLIERDMPEVLAIENASFSEPLTKEDFLEQLRQREVYANVAEVGDTAVAYMMCELRKKSLRLVSLAVHPGWRRLGIGSQMICKLQGKLSSHRRVKLYAVVPERNLQAQLFFRDSGMPCKRTLRRYFTDTREDAYLMQYVLPSAVDGDGEGDDE